MFSGPAGNSETLAGPEPLCGGKGVHHGSSSRNRRGHCSLETGRGHHFDDSDFSAVVLAAGRDLLKRVQGMRDKV